MPRISEVERALDFVSQMDKTLFITGRNHGKNSLEMAKVLETYSRGLSKIGIGFNRARQMEKLAKDIRMAATQVLPMPEGSPEAINWTNEQVSKTDHINQAPRSKDKVKHKNSTKTEPINPPKWTLQTWFGILIIFSTIAITACYYYPSPSKLAKEQQDLKEVKSHTVAALEAVDRGDFTVAILESENGVNSARKSNDSRLLESANTVKEFVDAVLAKRFKEVDDRNKALGY